jgi:class 3 adenylate cyclase
MCHLFDCLSGIKFAMDQLNQFVGDGLLALFGLNVDPATACRQAMRAAAMVASNVEYMNHEFAAELQEPIQFGIGIHAGEVIIGHIGEPSFSHKRDGKKESTAHRLSRACRPYPRHRRTHRSTTTSAMPVLQKTTAKSNRVNKSAKVVLGCGLISA